MYKLLLFNFKIPNPSRHEKNSISHNYIYDLFILCSNDSLNTTSESLDVFPKLLNQENSDLQILEADGTNKIAIIEKDGYIYFGELETIKRAEKQGLLQDWEGPFTAESAKTVPATNVVEFFNDIPGWAAQSFVTDHWLYSAIVPIPQNSVGRADVPNPTGYSNLNTRQIGVFYNTSTGGTTTLTIGTYTIWVKSTILGQSVNLERPTSLTEGFDFTYYYLEF